MTQVSEDKVDTSCNFSSASEVIYKSYNESCNVEKNIKVSKKSYSCAVVIPALNPIENLVNFVKELLNRGFPNVLVVNDGSSQNYNYIFKQLISLEGCTLLSHNVNKGKGNALKTAFRYFLDTLSYLDGVITADADGQHTPEDICKVADMFTRDNTALILGMRNFNDNNVPKRSSIGNKITSILFRILYGSYIEDTQTGLRGIPTTELEWISQIQGDRYEYEINMLIQSKLKNIEITSVPIKTLYFDNNKGTHFSPIKDTCRILMFLISGILKFSLSALISGIIDILLFSILNSTIFYILSISFRLLFSTAIARILSSCFNFLMNQRIFKSNNNKLSKMVLRYYTLWIFQLIASYGLLFLASTTYYINDTILKIIIDIILGFFGYQVQLRWVFNNRDIRISKSMDTTNFN